MPLRFALLVAGLSTLIVGGSAQACSVIDTYVRPSNFELVQLADAIVVATAEAETGTGSPFETTVRFRVNSTLKGQTPAIVDYSGTLGNPAPSDLTDLSASHWEGHAGPCNRMTFARGGRYLLFLARNDHGEWGTLGFPFSRINEDYSGEDNPWMRAVRRYLAVQQDAAPTEQIDALRGMLESGRGREGEPLSESELADIRDHLSSLSPYKPTAFLLDALARLERREMPEFGVRSFAANRENSGAEAAASMLLDEPLQPQRENWATWRLRVLESLVQMPHPEAAAMFERLFAAGATDPRALPYALRFFAGNGQYARAYGWIETDLLPLLPELDSDVALALLAAVGEIQRGESWEETDARWRQHPHSASTWPHLAFALRRYAVATIDPEFSGFDDAIAAVPLPDFRARPELTLMRAADYDEAVTAWARQELASLPLTAAAEEAGDEFWRTDPALLPLRILVTAWAADWEPDLEHAFCQGGARRRLLIRALGLWGDGLYDHLLARIAATPALDEEDRELVLSAAAVAEARRIARSRFQPDPGEHDDWLLTRILNGNNLAGPPITCPSSSGEPISSND